MSERIDSTKAEIEELRRQIASLKMGVSKVESVDLSSNAQDQVQTVDDPFQDLLFSTGVNFSHMPVSFRSGTFAARMINLNRIRRYLILKRGGEK